MALRGGPARHARRVSPGAGARRWITIATGIAVAALASVTLLAATHTSIATTRSLVTPTQVTAWESTYRQDLCVRQEFQRLVPKGAVVYAGDGFGQPEQILLEAATLWAKPVPDPSAAQWIVTIKPGNGCLGFVFHAHRVS